MTVFIYLIFSGADFSAAEGFDTFSFDFGRSKDDISITRLGFRKDFVCRIKNTAMPLSGYMEMSLNLWDGHRNILAGIGLSPVFIIPLCPDCQNAPYLEAGIGISLISEEIIDNRDMSSMLQFEDRIGCGVKLRGINIHVRYMHYSNAGRVQPNQGIDIFIAGVTFKL